MTQILPSEGIEFASEHFSLISQRDTILPVYTPSEFMAVLIKTPEEIEKMRVSARLAAELLEIIKPHVLPGVSTDDLDRICHEYTLKVQKAIPANVGYRGFPKSICTSVNQVVCHGIPGDKRLKNGDIINIDVAVLKDGYHGDTSRMYYVGEPSVQARRLVDTTYTAMKLALQAVRPGLHLGDIGHIIQSYAEARGYSVVREYCGHGIGRAYHEDPQILHYGEPGTGLVLEPGMIFTIEPMINAGRRQVKLLHDGWTVVTKDHSLSAQWEHTVLVTEADFDVLTARADESFTR